MDPDTEAKWDKLIADEKALSLYMQTVFAEATREIHSLRRSLKAASFILDELATHGESYPFDRIDGIWYCPTRLRGRDISFEQDEKLPPNAHPPIVIKLFGEGQAISHQQYRLLAHIQESSDE